MCVLIPLHHHVYAGISAQLQCFDDSESQCNGTQIDNIDSVSGCCSLSDGYWYILDANASLDCTPCISELKL